MTSRDGVPLAAVQLRHDPGGPPTGLVFAVGHGFTHHTGRRDTRRVLSLLARHADVVAVDLRGHGRSGGRSTVGDAEVLDLAAAVEWGRRQGYREVVTIGFSLSAAVAVCHAAGVRGTGDTAPDAVIAVSGPARWFSRETAPMRRVHWLLEQPHGRLTARLLGVRLDGPWGRVPPSPVEVVGTVAPIPLLLVHGDADPYFAPAHAHALHRATGGHAELWLEAGMGHGESGTGADLTDRLARWAIGTVGGGPRTGAADPHTVPPAGAPGGASTVVSSRSPGSEVA